MNVGDHVLVDGKTKAVVEAIVVPGTPLGEALGYRDSPRFLLRYENDLLVEEDSTDYDLVLLSRADQ